MGNYLQSESDTPPDDEAVALEVSQEVFLAIDVECVATGTGFADRAVGSVAAVDEDEKTVFFEYVRPAVPVRSCLTPLTGIRPENLENASSFDEVVARLKKLISPTSTVLVGQGIKGDLAWLGLAEGVDFKRAEDVAQLFCFWSTRNDGSGRQIFFSLRHECLHLFGTDIQEGAHSPEVDARYAMRLLNSYGRSQRSEAKLEEAREVLKRAPPTPSFASRMPFIDGCEVSSKSREFAGMLPSTRSPTSQKKQANNVRPDNVPQKSKEQQRGGSRTCHTETSASESPTRTRSSGASDCGKDLVEPVAFTTVTLNNLPLGCRLHNVVATLDIEGFCGEYNFVYVPVRLETDSPTGSAQVNLLDHATALRFRKHFEGFARWVQRGDDWQLEGATASDTKAGCCTCVAQSPQGINALIEKYRNSPLMLGQYGHVPEGAKPAVFANGAQIPFPAPKQQDQRQRAHMRGSGLGATEFTGDNFSDWYVYTPDDLRSPSNR
jgi:RNA exonuclease 4